MAAWSATKPGSYDVYIHTYLARMRFPLCDVGEVVVWSSGVPGSARESVWLKKDQLPVAES